MDWTALWLSIRLSTITVLLLLPVGILVGRLLAYREFPGKGVVEAIVALPLVLPPTVFGYYLLVAFGASSPLGELWQIGLESDRRRGNARPPQRGLLAHSLRAVLLRRGG